MLSVGGREEYYTAGHGVFTPTVAGGYRISERLKLRGSVGRAFRLPTYTDLYYSDPATVGNPGLQPETAWSYDGGLEWTLARRLAGSVTVFRRDEKNDIDYVLVPDDPAALAAPLSLVPRTCTTPTSPGCIYQARNLQALSFTGVEAAVRWQVDRPQPGFVYLHRAARRAAGAGWAAEPLSVQLSGEQRLHAVAVAAAGQHSVAHPGGSHRALQQRSLCVVGPGHYPAVPARASFPAAFESWPTLRIRRLREWRCRDARLSAGSRCC